MKGIGSDLKIIIQQHIGIPHQVSKIAPQGFICRCAGDDEIAVVQDLPVAQRVLAV
jgi:hypothetical protein